MGSPVCERWSRDMMHEGRKKTVPRESGTLSPLLSFHLFVFVVFFFFKHAFIVCSASCMPGRKPKIAVTVGGLS